MYSPTRWEENQTVNSTLTGETEILPTQQAWTSAVKWTRIGSNFEDADHSHWWNFEKSDGHTTRKTVDILMTRTAKALGYFILQLRGGDISIVQKKKAPFIHSLMEQSFLGYLLSSVLRRELSYSKSSLQTLVNSFTHSQNHAPDGIYTHETSASWLRTQVLKQLR